MAEIPVNERIDVAELQLDGGPDVVEADHLGERRNDSQAALHTAPMVVGHLQYEKVFEDIAVDHNVPPSLRFAWAMRLSAAFSGHILKDAADSRMSGRYLITLPRQCRLRFFEQKVAGQLRAIEEGIHVLERR